MTDNTNPEKNKRGRKPKAVKEIHNNIDNVILENNNSHDIQNNITPEEINTPETKDTKPKKIVKKDTTINSDNQIKPKKEKIVKPTKTNTKITTTTSTTENNFDNIINNLLNDEEKIIPQDEIPSQQDKISPTIIPYKTEIKTIYHISDIHIQLYKRHDEYQQIFTKVYEYLKNEKQKFHIPEYKNREIPLIIVLTGDILHSKSDLSPECIQLTYNFIKTLASIMPLVMIPGNHDININNRDRLDALTPIIADLPSAYPIYYLLHSGVYQLANIMFYHASIFDYKIISPSQVKIHNPPTSSNNTHQHKPTNIMLYHGRVNGAVLFNGMEFNDNKSANKTITPSTFSEYDITLLGDIHKHQFLTVSMAYAGSLIQQNLGEDIRGHGIIKWNVDTRRGELVEIPNDWSYLTMFIDNKKANYLCTASDGTHNSACSLTKNIRVRILYRNTPETYIADYITLLKMNHNVLEYNWNNDEVIQSAINGSTVDNEAPTTSTVLQNSDMDTDIDNTYIDNIDGNGNNINAIEMSKKKDGKIIKSLIDITSPEVQNRYLEEFLQENEPNITPEEIGEIKQLNIAQNILLKETNKNYNSQAFNGNYKIKRLEFSNLFSFGENNVINFSDFRGIVGIIAPNHLGKSSIIDIIIYTLFDEFTRKGSTKDIININKEDFHIKMDINIGNWTYTIIKTGYRTRVGVSVKVEFFRVNDADKTMERLEEDNATKTKDRIAEYFGNYEDIIHTSFSIQHDNACFIDASNIKRKDELERIMRFEIMKKLYEMANQKYNKDKAVLEHLKKKIKNDEIVAIKKAKNKASRMLSIIKEDRGYAKSRIKELHETILNTSKQLHTECNKFIEDNNEEECQEMLEDISCQIEENKEQILQNQSELIQIIKSIKSAEHKLHYNNVSGFIGDLKRIKVILGEAENEYSEIIKITNQKIKTLDQTKEKLFKSRKPANIKIPSPTPTKSTSSSNTVNTPTTLNALEYLNGLKDKYLKEMEECSSAIKSLNDKIKVIKDKEEEIESNNKKILELEKQITKLPDTLTNMSDNTEELEAEYINYLEKFINSINIIPTNNSNNSNNSNSNINKSITKDKTIKDILKSPEYRDYATKSGEYFLAMEISKYAQSNLNNEELILEQQEKLESRNGEIKKEMKNIFQLEQQIKTLENKKTSGKNQINLILADVANLEENNKIDNEIATNKEKRNKYETRINNAEKELQILKQINRQIKKIEDNELIERRLQMDLEKIENILAKFDVYRIQIEANKPINETITLLRAELSEFEEVLELVEKRFTEEQTNLSKSTALLEQMKKDLTEAKELEAKMRISEFYKNALKQLPYILLNKIKPILEKKVNDLLTITTDFTVKFDLTDGKIDIYLDRSIYKDKTRNILINNASGFERFIASLAIRIALLELSNLPKINFMAIDEGWSSFDTHNINNVSIILDYLTHKFDFILTISHLIQIKEHCDIQISLKRDDRGFSKIVY